MSLSIASLVHDRPSFGGILSDSRISRTEYYYPPSPAASQRSTARSNSDTSCCADSPGSYHCETHTTRLPSISSLLADCPAQEPTPRQSPQMSSLPVPGHPYKSTAKYSFSSSRPEFPPLAARPLYSPKSSPPASYLTPSPTTSYFAQHGQTTVERYPCDCCNKSFSRPSSLRIHKHSHTGERPFICSIAGCERAFSVRSNMRRHMKVHQAE